MSVRIGSVEPQSIAARHGIKAGHILHKINGHEIGDVLDYRFYMADAILTLDMSCDGKAYAVKLRKPEYDDLGLIFDTYLIDYERHCMNNCIFCFIDQLPAGLRETLYFKDDDSRLGFLFGNYITLTNLQGEDIDRMIAMRTSPVNISIHTMNPELRVRMMGSPRAGEVLAYIPRLLDSNIKLNGQIVLCPGINDGAELEYTLGELSKFGDNLQSVSIVPVGLTRHRDKLPALRLPRPREAAAVIALVERFAELRLKRCGVRTFFASDEFYLRAGMPLPADEYYEEYYQLENGVGLVSLLRREFYNALEDEPARSLERCVTIITGTAAGPMILELAEAAMAKFAGLSAEVLPVTNHFLGEDITVAGLVCGCDIIAQSQEKMLGDEVLIPASMLRHEGDLFLDGMPLGELAAALGRPVRAVGCDGYELLKAVLGQRRTHMNPL